MVKWAATIMPESIILVEGTVQKTSEEIKGTSVSDAQVVIKKLYVVSSVHGALPFSLEDASRAEADQEKEDPRFNKVQLDTRLNNRVLELRTPANQAIFTLQAAITDMFRSFLKSENFTEIHSPKLQGTTTETDGSVFKVAYFQGDAFLAQTPQFAKQMAIAADFERVFEIGSVFRANDNTHRHLTEFVALDLEMTIEEHYHEVVELLDSLFLYIFRGLRDKYRHEIDVVGKQFPSEAFKWREGSEGTLKLKWPEALALLRDAGEDVNEWNEDAQGNKVKTEQDIHDLSINLERKLGKLVRETYKTDYFILDKFPLSARQFYTMPDAADPTASNSYDFFMRGEEILSGSQRINDASFLEQRMVEQGIDLESMGRYLNAFKVGMSPHGGAGIGKLIPCD
jgi:aspartyl-tRNA synthetase